MSTSSYSSTTGDLPGLHGRLTVLPAAPRDRAGMTEQLARLLVRADSDAPTTTHAASARFRQVAIRLQAVTEGWVRRRARRVAVVRAAARRIAAWTIVGPQPADLRERLEREVLDWTRYDV